MKAVIGKYKEYVEKKDYAHKHQYQNIFDTHFAGSNNEQNKYYCFGPDAVNKVRALSSVFHNMQRYHKFGLSEIPDKQTIHNTAISFDMANSTITQPIKPKLGQFQQWDDMIGTGESIDVEKLLISPIHTYLYSYPEGKKRMVIKQTPYRNKQSLRFANAVYGIYSNLLHWINTEKKNEIVNLSDEKRFKLVIDFFELTGDDAQYHTIDDYDLNDKSNREIDGIEDTSKRIDLMTDLTSKDGISLFQYMSSEAKSF